MVVLGMLSVATATISGFSAFAMSVGPSYPDWVVSTPNIAAEQLVERDRMTSAILAMVDAEPRVLAETDSSPSSPGFRPAPDRAATVGEVRLELRTLPTAPTTIRPKTSDESRNSREARALAELRKRFARTEKEIARIRRRAAELAKRQLALPERCRTALSRVEATIAGIKASTTMEGAQAAGLSELRSQYDALKECQGDVGRLGKVTALLTRVDREIRASETRWNMAKRRAGKLPELVAEGDAIVARMKEARTAVAVALKSGDLANAESQIEDNILGQKDDLDAVIQKIDAATRATTYVGQHTRRVAEARRAITALKKLGRDTARIEELLKRIEAVRERMKAHKAGSTEYSQDAAELAELNQTLAEATPATEDVDTTLSTGATTGADTSAFALPDGL